MKQCSKCNAEPAKRGQRWGKTCHAAYMREWRRTHPIADEERRKSNCRSYTNVMVRRGHMVRRPCWCGKQAEAHHPDYDRPRLVIWLCRTHHLTLHRWIDRQPVRT